MGGTRKGRVRGEHMVVAGEAVGGVESEGGVNQRRFGVGWLGWVGGWGLQGGEEEGGHAR